MENTLFFWQQYKKQLADTAVAQCVLLGVGGLSFTSIVLLHHVTGRQLSYLYFLIHKASRVVHPDGKITGGQEDPRM